MREINEIIIHCADTKPDMDIGAKEINDWHVQKGWSGIGYHFVIRRNGAVEHGRSIEKVGAHCYGKNKNSIGICLVGGMSDIGGSENNFNLTQFDSMLEIIESLKLVFPDIKKVSGHRDYSLKECPCFDVNDYYDSE